MERLKKVYKVMTSREMLLYMLFGTGTAAIDFLVAKLCYQTLPLPKSALLTALANAIAWVLSVTFAFVTNKLFVFQSRRAGRKHCGLKCSAFTARAFYHLCCPSCF